MLFIYGIVINYFYIILTTKMFLFSLKKEKNKFTKVFWLFKNGHFFCPFFKSLFGFLKFLFFMTEKKLT